jgi:hypothetical protein
MIHTEQREEARWEAAEAYRAEIQALMENGTYEEDECEECGSQEDVGIAWDARKHDGGHKYY